jgi:diguanylate cyclase (GGDEF)-like protein
METLPVILVVDDNETNIDILLELLGEKYDIIVAIDGFGALEIAQEEKIDLILLDIMMPEIDGYEVCKRLKADPKTEDTPVIFLTAKSDEDSIERAYDVGGIDYITKPFRPKELLARVNRELKIQTLIRELKASYEKLQELAQTDPLTKLYNRRYFQDISKNILNLSKREQEPLSIVMVDIDKFKRINDTYGHQIGDEVIVSLANILQNSKRESDIVCRYGGEEFVILLPNTAVDGALDFAEKLREKVESNRLILKDLEVNFTVSLGVSAVRLDRESNIERALNRADEALYESKNSGRNRVSLKEY